MDKAERIVKILKENRDFTAKIVEIELNDKNVLVFDLSDDNKELYDIDLDNTDAFSKYIFGKLKKEKKKVGAGGYLEDRLIYKRSKHFDNDGEPRSVHLGIDLWMEEGTPVYAPLPGVVHSFGNNDTFGDYGYTVILEHLVEGETFYTLYGHLSEGSIIGKEAGQQVRKGDQIASFGSELENGQWPPHLHFQIITDMLGKKGDFAGVAPPSEIDDYKKLCINPNLILQIDQLK